jgi:hypothetical protein
MSKMMMMMMMMMMVMIAFQGLDLLASSGSEFIF